MNRDIQDLDNRLRRRLGLEDLPKISVPEWEKKLDEEQLDKGLMNELVMDYLVTHGDRATVDSFRRESNY